MFSRSFESFSSKRDYSLLLLFTLIVEFHLEEDTFDIFPRKSLNLYSMFIISRKENLSATIESTEAKVDWKIEKNPIKILLKLLSTLKAPVAFQSC